MSELLLLINIAEIIIIDKSGMPDQKDKTVSK